MATIKNLKKSNFLSTFVVGEALTRAQLVDKLDEYDFIDSWLTFLIDHFVGRNKLIVNEAGLLELKGKKGGAKGPLKVYQVRIGYGDDTLFMVERALEEGQLMDKAAGEATTKKGAVKNMTAKIYAQYKVDIEAVRALLVAEDADSEPEAA